MSNQDNTLVPLSIRFEKELIEKVKLISLTQPIGYQAIIRNWVKDKVAEYEATGYFKQLQNTKNQMLQGNLIYDTLKAKSTEFFKKDTTLIYGRFGSGKSHELQAKMKQWVDGDDNKVKKIAYMGSDASKDIQFLLDLIDSDAKEDIFLVDYDDLGNDWINIFDLPLGEFKPRYDYVDLVAATIIGLLKAGGPYGEVINTTEYLAYTKQLVKSLYATRKTIKLSAYENGHHGKRLLRLMKKHRFIEKMLSITDSSYINDALVKAGHKLTNIEEIELEEIYHHASLLIEQLNDKSEDSVRDDYDEMRKIAHSLAMPVLSDLLESVKAIPSGNIISGVSHEDIIAELTLYVNNYPMFNRPTTIDIYSKRFLFFTNCFMMDEMLQHYINTSFYLATCRFAMANFDEAERLADNDSNDLVFTGNTLICFDNIDNLFHNWPFYDGFLLNYRTNLIITTSNLSKPSLINLTHDSFIEQCTEIRLLSMPKKRDWAVLARGIEKGQDDYTIESLEYELSTIEKLGKQYPCIVLMRFDLAEPPYVFKLSRQR